jgi:redox-sensitive bicupin YhaK (pirin superfamily)
VTVVRRGYVDHSDSLGATARYGQGDVQWLTTGSGIMHAEMFPLLDPIRPNPMELFQIWLNLPPESKMVPAYFGMLWGEDIPRITPSPGVDVEVIAGTIDSNRPPSPPPDSWGSRSDSHLAIWHITLEAGARWQMPVGPAGVNRMLHCVRGDDVSIGSTRFGEKIGARLRPEIETVIENHGEPAAFLLLQGQPIDAPVFQLGPFVMNSAEELRQAVEDYHRTQFGGWPWSRRDPVHPRSEGRFAIHADGRVEHRDMIPTG